MLIKEKPLPRPCKPRWIRQGPEIRYFHPAEGIVPREDALILTLDELEALRLADREGLSQEEAALEMNVSRATFGRIVSRARAVTATALTSGRPILIGGGPVEIPPPEFRQGRGRHGGPGGHEGSGGHGRPHGAGMHGGPGGRRGGGPGGGNPGRGRRFPGPDDRREEDHS